MSYIKECAPLIEKYDGFIVDLWGVVHDGSSLYDGITKTLEAIYQQGKPLVFLSNAPRRLSHSVKRLQQLGIKDNYYRAVITSGETTIDYATNTYDSCALYYIGPQHDAPWCEKKQMLVSTNLHYTDDMTEAKAVLCVGHEYDNQPNAELMPALQQAHQAGLPLLCANPDRYIVTRDGWECRCAGDIADAYEALGGTVEYFGKPYQRVYDEALRILDIPSNRILAVGDNPDTDIAGAHVMGIDSLLLTQGVLSNILRNVSQQDMMYYVREKMIPATYVARAFSL